SGGGRRNGPTTPSADAETDRLGDDRGLVVVDTGAGDVGVERVEHREVAATQVRIEEGRAMEERGGQVDVADDGLVESGSGQVRLAETDIRERRLAQVRASERHQRPIATLDREGGEGAAVEHAADQLA